MNTMTRRKFVEDVLRVRENEDCENALQSLTDDLGYVEILAKLVPKEALEAFAKEDGPLFKDGDINWPSPEPKEEKTFYVSKNCADVISVKEGEFFKSQGGLTQKWGKDWKPLQAFSIGDARRKGAALYGVTLSRLYDDEK